MKLSFKIILIFFLTFFFKGISAQCIDEGELLIPSVFTPNFDGVNEGFNFSGGCVVAVDKKIYSRWGVLIFESSQVKEVWDGRTTAAELAPEGTYFYIFILDLEEEGVPIQKTFKGSVSLLR